MPSKDIGRLPWYPARLPLLVAVWLPLTRVVLVAKVQEALQQAGLNHKDYNGHSFRIGAATSAAQKGLDSLIQILGRWKSEAYKSTLSYPALS